MDERDAAQAAELVRALRNQLHVMTYELVRLERLDVTARAAGHRPSGAKRLRCGETLTRHRLSSTCYSSVT